MLVPRRQASAIDSATPLGLQAPGLTITSASRKRLPWGRFCSDMKDVSVKERECSQRPQPDARLQVGPIKLFWGHTAAKGPKVLFFGPFSPHM